MKTIFHIELDSLKHVQEPDDRFLKQRAAAYCGVSISDILSCKILKRSLDARKKPQVKILYSVEAEIAPGVLPGRAVEVSPESSGSWSVPGKGRAPEYPVVIGAGPAGLFAALVLAIAGCRPVVLERGRDVLRRKEDIDSFFRTRSVNPESNYLFGEGGAGTWSDGKLFTRIRDIRAEFVMRTFVEAGAPEDILYYAHPHLGSDRLPQIISGIRERIISLGGTFLWDSRVDSIETDGKFRAVKLSCGERIEAPVLIAAGGHSSTGLIRALASAGAGYRMKGFQIGCRIEHPQEFINLQQFGTAIPGPLLGAAEYLFSSRPVNGRFAGATTFCMCPGGEIIPAVCKPDCFSTNGMSRSSRDGVFANAAIVTTIPETAFPDLETAFGFIEKIEHSAFRSGGGDFTAPAQTVLDFLHGKKGAVPKDTSYRLGLAPARLDMLLPQPCSAALREALRHFDRMSPGYMKNGTLIGVETHVSSPVRFDRDPVTKESGVSGIYICGEGGGAAGGIVSAAVDGIVCAEAWLKKFIC